MSAIQKNGKIGKALQSGLLDPREFEAASMIARHIKKNDFVLNIGASWGRDTLFLAMRGIKVVSVDIDFWSNTFARGLFWPNSVQADAQWLPFRRACFSAIILADCLEHIKDDQRVIQEIFHVLVPGGSLVVAVPMSSGGKAYHLRGYKPEHIKTLLEDNGFDIRRIILRGGLITWTRFFGPQLQSISSSLVRKWALKFITLIDLIIGALRLPVLRRSPYAGTYIIGRRRAMKDNSKARVPRTDFARF